MHSLLKAGFIFLVILPLCACAGCGGKSENTQTSGSEVQEYLKSNPELLEQKTPDPTAKKQGPI